MIPIPFAGDAGALAVKILVVVALLSACYVKGCSDEKDRFDDYKIAVKAVGEAQEARTRERIALDKGRKEKADEENRRARTRVAADGKRLSDLVAGFSLLPPTGPAAGGADRICFDASDFGGAVRAFLQDAAGFAVEGDKAVIDLDTAKRWGQGR